jgi:hypothetical protein
MILDILELFLYGRNYKMAKTDFANGTVVTSVFLDSIFLNNGHQHDGGSDDGHASKIDLTSQVQNELPLANVKYGFARSGAQNIMVTAEGRTVNITSGACLCYRRNGTADHPVYPDVAYFVNPNTDTDRDVYTITNITNNGFEYEGTGDGIVLAGTAWNTTKWLIIYAVYDSSDGSHKFVAAADWRPIINTSTTKYIRAISYVGINYSGTPALYSMDTNGVRTWFTGNTGRLQLFAETATTAAGVDSVYSTGLPTDISNAFYGVAFARVTAFSDPGTPNGTYAIKSGNRISISDVVLALDSSSTVIPIPHMLNNITTSMSNYSGTATHATTVLLQGFYNPLVDQIIE